MSIENYTSEQLLMELIRRNGREDAPGKVAYSGEWFRTQVDIGEVGEAFIMVDADDFRALAELLADE